MKVTLSVIKADIGGYVGHSNSHPDILAAAKESMEKAKTQGLFMDYHVTACGDDLQLIMTHQHGELNERVHKLAWDTFIKGTDVAKKLKLYGAGQDLLTDEFSGNMKGMGHCIAEMTIMERAFGPEVIFMANKIASGVWNHPFYKTFGGLLNGCSPVGTLIAQTQVDRSRMGTKTTRKQVPKRVDRGKPSCFVLQDLSERFGPVYTEIIKPTVEGCGLTCRRADELYTSDSLICKILSSIAEANVVISDLTGENPNVLYETGLAHKMDKTVILITQSPPPPSDLRHLEYIPYEDSIKGARNLTVHLEHALKCSLPSRR